jgi:hypothetical protein
VQTVFVTRFRSTRISPTQIRSPTFKRDCSDVFSTSLAEQSGICEQDSLSSSAAVALNLKRSARQSHKFGEGGLIGSDEVCKEYANLPPHKVRRFTVNLSTFYNLAN